MDSQDLSARHLADPSDPRNRRASTRAPVLLTADFRRAGRPPFKLQIINLSQTGCQCETVGRAHVGDQVWLTIGDMVPIGAVVRWVTPFGFGCEWVRELHVSVIEHIKSRYPQLV